MKHLATIQAQFLKYSVKGNAKDFLQKAIKRHDEEAIKFWLKVINRNARKDVPVVNFTTDEFKTFKKSDSTSDKQEIDKIAKDVDKDFQREFNLELPLDRVKPMQDLSEKDEHKVLISNNGHVPKYAFVVSGKIYLNVKAIEQDKDYTNGLKYTIYHECGHFIFHKYRNKAIELMNKYDLTGDYEEDFAETIAYGMDKRLTDDKKMFKIFRDFKELVLKRSKK